MPQQAAPSSMAMAKEWTGSLSDKGFTKAVLLELAHDLGIAGVSASLLKPRIQQIINDHLKASPQLSLEKRFQGLFAYKKSSAVDGTARGPHNGLTSAGKDIADANEEASGDAHTTSSHQVLRTLLKTSDPPGRHMTFQASGVLSGTPADDSLRRSKRKQDAAESDSDKSSTVNELPDILRGQRSLGSTQASLKTLPPPLSLSPSGCPPAPEIVSPLSPPVPSDSPPSLTNTSPLSPQPPVPPVSKNNLERSFSQQLTSEPEPLPQTTEEDEDSTLWPSTPRKRDMKRRNICVTFRDPLGRAGPEEIWLLSGPQIPLTKAGSPNSDREWYVGQLSDIVPAALAQHTPMKNGRIARPAVHRGGNMIDIGSVEALAEGRMKYHGMGRINDYNLEMNEDGDLVCNVFWQRESDLGFNAVLPNSTLKSNDAGSSVSQSDELCTSVNLHSAEQESSGVLDSTASKSTPATFSDLLNEHDRLVQYIRTVIGDPPKPRKVKTCEDALKLYRIIRDGCDILDDLGWSSTKKGGYKISCTDKAFPGKSFTKDTVYEACQVARSSATQYASLFQTKKHPALMKLADWVEDPDDVGLARKFGAWSIRELVEWKEQKMSASSSKQGSRHSKVEVQGKRARSVSEEEEEVPSTSTSARRMRKSKQRATSYSLDSD
ncbi:hypothetical protein BDY19DRAFT_910496 [Irpex rosettiformis]|uniref:Uncharacterized protein n=1 Tax=Irpex rosettiformis TaxID=378272 RepID=A0ACB8TNI0_9APHY|nr:hypothetical protein BDY19DRAFT_910496 [Irpex rosettiformis]